MKRIVILVAGFAGATVINPATAFMFADGTTAQCVAGGRVVAEKIAQLGDPAVENRVARTARVGDGWQITWNQERLKLLSPEVRDFLFFHECAHARIPTENEREANCTGLKDMRAAGRAGPAFETRLRGNFPANSDYWNDTFKCADDGTKPAPATKPAG
jgi:hypothetical protein